MELLSYLNLVALSLTMVSLISVTAAAPPSYMASPPSSPLIPSKINHSNNDIILLKYENENRDFDNYKYAYEQSDGTRVEQVGQIKNKGTEGEILTVSGQFRWISPEGIVYTVHYTADEEGYRPEIEQETIPRDYPLPTVQLPPRPVPIASYQPSPHYVATLIG